MNRVLVHMCDCERRRRRLAAAERVADHIHKLVGGFVDCTLRPLGEEADDRVYFWLTNVELEPTADYANAAVHLASELRIVADQCTVAAETLEGGAS